jgi:PAS domain S-box-containing protein
MWRMRGLAPRAEPMGYDELVGMIHPDDRPRIVAAMQDRRGRGDGRTDYEFRIIRPDGEERVIQSRSVRTYDAEDKTVSTVAINIDMTERRRAEQALAESAARFQLAVETAELGFAQLDPATGKGLWSDRLFRIYGLAPRAERPSVEEILALVHPDDRERVAETMSRQRVGTDGDVVETEFRIVRPDGEERILQVRSVRLRGADGTETLSTVTLDVTERRRAEQALAESEARLRLAVDTAGLGVAELNMGTGQGFWNDRLYRICGLEPDGGRPALPSVLALVHPADRDRISQAVAAQRAGEGGDVVELNFRLLRPDGEERVLEVRSTVLRQAGRETLLTVTHDITEQRHAAQALADSEMRFRLAVETAGLGVVDRNLATGEGDWSPQMWRIMGMEAGAHPLGKEESLSIVHPDDRALVEEIRARHAAGKVGDTNEYEFRMMRPDGQVRMLHARSVTLRGADGSPRLLAVNQDVTEQRRAEQALADSELRFRLAVETAELGVADRNLATGEGSWSDQMCRIMGFEPGAQPLGSAETLALVHPEDRALIEGMRARHAAGQVGDIHEFEYRMMRPDGQVRILHARSVTLRAADGAPRLLAVNQDVTERRRAEQALADSELRLRLATAAAGVGIWDHDPATGITVWTDEMFRLRGLPVAESVPPREVLLDLVVEQDRALLDAAWERLKAGEPDVRYDYRVRWPDGTLRHLRSEGRALHDEAGRVVRLLGMVTDVTAEREAAIALLDRTTTLELAIEAADLGIWMREPGETTRIASARLWEMVGHPGREGAMTREELLACLHPDDRAAVLREWVLANDEPFPRQREFRAIWPDGTVRHFQSRRAVMRDAAGRSPRVVGLIADVTEARRSAAALEASEARLRLAVETAGLGVFDIDPVTRAGHWSERMWRMRGLEPRPGKPGIEETLALLHPEDRDRALAHTRGQAVLAEGELSEFEVRVVWPDGSVHHIQSRSIAQRGVDGTVKRIFGINQDVTESGAAAQALAEAAARYELAVDAAEMGVFEFDPETRTGYWSERIWRMRGLEPRPGTLSFQEVIDLVHPEDREPVAARMREQFAGPDGMRGEYEFRIVRPDGAVRYLQSRAITQRRPDGGLHRLFGINIDVTERRLAAQALEESEARLRLASEAAELGVFQVNIPDGTGHWSERMWHIRGLAPRPGLPDSALAVATVHPDDRALVSGLREAAAGWAPGESVRRQFRVIWPDGSLRHVASYAVALHGRENGGFSLIGVNLDITEQVVREQALRETAARFELAIDAAGLAVWDWDPATDRMTWSPRMWALLGVPPRDEVPDAEARLWAVLPEDRDRVPAVWIRRAGGEASERGEDEFRILRPDGSLRYFRWQGTPLRDAEGRIVRFAGVVADVTEARLADLALRTSEELFRMAAEAAEQGVWNYDLVTDTTTWSAQLWRIHGLPPQEGAPAREDRIAFLHPEDREEVLGLFDKLLSSAPNTVMRQSFRILRVDGAVRMLERQSMVVTGADGRPARIVGVVHDVTDAREQAAQTMVADKLATLGEMAGAIAHELAQPLQAVIATAATARMRLAQAVDEATVEKVSDRLAWIEKQTSRAGKTIQHLLAFSRGESSAGLCRLADALEGAMELAGHGLRRDGVEVLVEMPANLPPVRGGQVEIEQVLVNLLNNARDAMAESRSRRIRIEARHEGDSIRLDVADTGNGVPADKMQRIFEPFYTTKPIGRGTGIGLSVARRTMQALGGGISVANNGTGACFSLTFRNAATDG